MSVAAKIKEVLEGAGIEYEVLEHDLAYTALEIAQAQHIPGRKLVKTVIVFIDKKPVICVLPGTHKVDFDKLKSILQFHEAHLANEGQVAALFPLYEVGAMPPFDHQDKLKVYLDKTLEENDTIAFNAGTHKDIVRIKLKDYLDLVQPTIIDFGIHI